MRSGTVNNDYDSLEEIKIVWDREHDFLQKFQSYQKGADFNQTGIKFSNFLETKISRSIISRNVSPDTLKPSQKFAHDVLVHMATREPGTSKN